MAALMNAAVAVSALALCMAVQPTRAEDVCSSSSSLNISENASSASTKLAYSIATSASNFTRNSRINVTIEGTFENFLLLTRDASSKLPVGTFEKLPANTTFLANCSTNATVTRGDAAGNLTNVTFTWVAPPASSASSVVFVTTSTASTASSSAGTATGTAMASRSLAPVPWCSLLLTLLFARALAVVATSG
ncbi:unnamed protein product [Lampetra fluviatilis]